MWTDAFSQIKSLTAGAPDSLVILILVSAGLFLLSLVFALVAVGSHVWWRIHKDRRRTQRDHWRAELLAVLADEKPPHSLTGEVAVAQRDAFLRFLLPYATTVQGYASECIEALARPYMPKLRCEIRSRRPLVRARAAQWIGLLGGPDQAGVLRKALDDPSDRVVEIAFRRLARLGGPDDAEHLLSCLDRLTHLDRRQISSALVKLGDGSASHLRAAMADDDRPPFARVCCAEALRWLGDTGAAPVAARLLREMDVEGEAASAEVTASLLRLLRAVGQDAHRSIVRRFCRSPVPFIRIHAARALGQLGTAADEELLFGLVEADDSRWVALSAARSLVDLGQMASLRALQHGENGNPRRAKLAADFLSANRS